MEVLEKKLPWLKYKDQKEVFLKVQLLAKPAAATPVLPDIFVSNTAFAMTSAWRQQHAQEDPPTSLLQAKQALANGKRLLEDKKAELASQQGPLKYVSSSCTEARMPWPIWSQSAADSILQCRLRRN